eukprot:CAMPEP_0173176334 /NCGR_PEP_ID=MMETSP1141-20130122/4389_1 /TAXON_ID=483371 /ORGANISM="non described non described, Strain CCMP2298" /LENGTH=341 /DNA_ID=CAMNT_0014098635 /DNA_START=89 /DNA_END=1111 /DNA_ORIENTATION=-
MSTELQRQVSALRKTQLEVLPLQKGRPSLFLAPAEAAAVDVSTIHEAACNGLATLQQYDDRFGQFAGTLLDPASVDLQRELKTAQENVALDAQLAQLLRLLSLYALEPSTHLVLEYLIRRFRVHEMNAHDLLQSMLLAHDHKIFARAVQLCKIADTPWAFLQGVKQSGLPLPRSALVLRLLKDSSLLELLGQYVQSALELVVPRGAVPSIGASVSPQSVQGANRVLSFYTAVVVELAEERVDDAAVRHMYLFLVEGLKNNYADAFNNGNGNGMGGFSILDQWRRSCCMILAQLSARTAFSKPLTKVFSAALGEAFAKAERGGGQARREIALAAVLLAANRK